MLQSKRYEDEKLKQEEFESIESIKKTNVYYPNSITKARQGVILPFCSNDIEE